jgi:hypothetical protein
VSINAAVEQALPLLRAEAEARMTSRVTIRRKTGRSTQNESTGRETPTLADVATDVPFRLDGSSGGDGGTRTVTINGVEYLQATAIGHLPASTKDLRANDLLEITSGEWAGATFRVIEAVSADQKTARRVPIVEA